MDTSIAIMMQATATIFLIAIVTLEISDNVKKMNRRKKRRKNEKN